MADVRIFFGAFHLFQYIFSQSFSELHTLLIKRIDPQQKAEVDGPPLRVLRLLRIRKVGLKTTQKSLERYRFLGRIALCPIS